jgi:hypothetical protein
MLDVQPNISRTSQYIGVDPIVNGQRSSFNSVPELAEGQHSTLNYYQVFQQKHGFLPDLSIIDLIFNMGPESVLVLQGQLNQKASR